jgi:outer membrane autotransporter protein
VALRTQHAPDFSRDAVSAPRPITIASLSAVCRIRSKANWLATSSAIALAVVIGIDGTHEAQAQSCTISGSSVTLTSGACAIIPNTTLNGSPAVHATTNAQITTNNVTINPFNGGSIGGLAETNGTIIFSSGSSINGNWATAASAQTGGQIIFQSGSVINPAFGGGGTALLANGVGSGGQPSQIIATGLSVNMNGGGGNVGAKATGGGIITLNNGTTIQFAAGGGGNTGIWASGTGSQIVTTGASVNMPGGGGGDTGARADTGGAVTLNGGSVAVLGNGGGETGLLAQSAGSTITATGTVVTVSGGGGDAGVSATTGGSIATTGGSVSVVNGAGGLLQNGGSVTMSGTDVTASGNGGYGFLFNNGGSADTLQYSGGTVTASAASFSVQGAAANINLSNAIAVTNNNTLLETTSGGNALFNAQASTLQGVISTQGGSTSTVNLTQGTVWTMTGNSNATNLTNDSSEIMYTAPTGDPTQLSSYKTLTVMNYTGAAGTLGFNTYLGTDGSASDRLVVNGGTATGNSILRITNIEGPGAETMANGILVVQTINGGTTAPGAFALNTEVRSGAFDYFLFRGGLNGSSPNDWFLRSSFQVGPSPGLPEETVPPIESLPSDPPPAGSLPPGTYPIIGPEIATYGVVQPIARELGQTTLGTLHERIGDTLLPDPCQAAAVAGPAMVYKAPVAPTGCTPGGWVPSVWARGFGQQVSNHYRAFADPRADGSLVGMQSGFDLWRGTLFPWGHDVAGLFFAYSNASIDVNGLVTNPAATGYVLTKTGTLNLNAWSGGAYWTHYGPSGWYLDLVLQGTDYAGGAQTQLAKLTTDGWGFISSLEAGYPIPVLWLGPGFVLEPQAQILWQQVSFNSGNDGLGDVALGTTSGTTGRIGLRGKWTILGAYGEVWEPYVRVNLWQDWGGQATTMFGADAAPLLERATRLETAAGLTARLTRSWSLYAQGGYQFALNGTDGGRRDGVKGDLGLRYSW